MYAVGLSDSGTFLLSYLIAPVLALHSYLGNVPPDFVGSYFYCESGVNTTWTQEGFYLSDVLWGCSAGNTYMLL